MHSAVDSRIRATLPTLGIFEHRQESLLPMALRLAWGFMQGGLGNR